MNPNLLALIVAAIWGLAPIFEKMSLKELNPMFVLFVRFVLVTCLILPFYLTSNSFSSILSLNLKNILLILIPGVLAVLGIYLYFNALVGSSASKIVPLTATYPLFYLFLWIFIFKRTNNFRNNNWYCFNNIRSICT